MKRGKAWLLKTPRSAFYLGITWSLVVAFGCALLLGSARYEHVDFVAFYCAGESIAHGADPYRQMPLNACEHRIASHDIYSSPATVPAPLPPYALVPLIPLSYMGAAEAYIVFLVASLAALAAGCITLSRVTGSGLILVLAAVAPAAWEDLGKGQPVPFVFAAIVGTGWALSRGYTMLAAVTAAATMIEPHVGLAVCAALFLLRPATRPVFAFIAIALAAVSCTAVSLPVAIEYLTKVLPLQAASEASWVNQLSLTKILIAFGTPEHLALPIAFAQYVIVLQAGIIIAGRVAIRYTAPAALAFIPPIFASIGGTYIHSSLLLVTLPGAILLTGRRPSGFVNVALAMLSAYWLAIGDPVELAVTSASAATIIYLWEKRVSTALVAAALVLTLGVTYKKWQPAYGPPPAMSSLPPTAYAEESWAEFVNAVNPSAKGQISAVSMKVPTWLGLLAFAGRSVALARRRRRLTLGEVPDKADQGEPPPRGRTQDRAIDDSVTYHRASESRQSIDSICDVANGSDHRCGRTRAGDD